MRHRLLQRTLFRMQCDAAFREAVAAGDAHALRGLADDEAAALRALDPAAVSADHRGRRVAQTLGNILTEFRLTAAAAPAGWAASFFSSGEFHQAMKTDARLPLAFAAFARRSAEESDDREFADFVALEAAMVEARRAIARPLALEPGEVQLAPRNRLVDVAEGTLDHAGRVRSRLEAGRRPPACPAALARTAERETVLVNVAPDVHPFRLPEVSVEALTPVVAELLRLAQQPLGRATRVELAERHGAGAGDVETFVASLVEDGVLVRGG